MNFNSKETTAHWVHVSTFIIRFNDSMFLVINRFSIYPHFIFRCQIRIGQNIRVSSMYCTTHSYILPDAYQI